MDTEGQKGEQTMKKIFNIEELKELFLKWQERLRVSHWCIGVQIGKSEDMLLQEVQGTNRISLKTEQALITVIGPEDYPKTPFEQDMEVSLVHELLHIPLKYFAQPEPETLEPEHMEAFIERTARLLVLLARKGDQS